VPHLIAGRRLSRPRLGVRGKFVASVSVLVATVLAVSLVSLLGLARMADEANTLYADNLTTSQNSSDLVAATLTLHESALYELATSNPATEADLTDEFNVTLLPNVYLAISALRASTAGNSSSAQAIDQIEFGLRQYLLLRRSFSSVMTLSREARSQLADRTDTVLESVVDLAEQLNQHEKVEAEENKDRLDATYRGTRRLLAGSVAAALLLGLIVATALSRNLMPRIRRYSAFATDIAADRPTAPLVPTSHDELTDLGSALNDMVRQRTSAGVAQEWQTEFVETLQVTGSEEEAHLLIQRHLQRSISSGDVLVLKRNNSANRLEAATDLADDSQLGERLVGAAPSACLALRLGRTHHEGIDSGALMGCTLCGNRGQLSTCEPLMISGEVIGSVLVSHRSALDGEARSKIRSTVAQAAPMLANLRNLALAEFRANNDPLTGLPNKRATEDTLKRMVAQANRSIAPFSAIMLDLDHFKQINDRFGHAMGDEVLAAVGAAIKSCLRDSDFGGRFGGEEFLILLPDTSTDGAMNVAEKLRYTIALVSVPGVDREITASLGVAGLLEHAGNSIGLLREADRAQYAAKAAGRNQTKLATISSEAAQELAQALPATS
jgi:diguanylate cyclase (GGDEF)-like protein